jgi:hypothetical protein
MSGQCSLVSNFSLGLPVYDSVISEIKKCNTCNSGQLVQSTDLVNVSSIL